MQLKVATWYFNLSDLLKESFGKLYTKHRWVFVFVVYYFLKLMIYDICGHFYKNVDTGSFDQEYSLPPQSPLNGKTKYDWHNFDFSRNAAHRKWDKDECVHIDPHIHYRKGKRVHTPHWNNPSRWAVLCMLIVFPIRGPDGILLDVRNSSLLFGCFSTRTLSPAAWTCTAHYTAPMLDTLLAPLAGERGGELV